MKFKTLNDASKYLANLEQEIYDLKTLFNNEKDELQASIIKAQKFTLSFDKKPAGISSMDLEGGKFKVPGGIRKLKQSYKLLADLSKKQETLEAVQSSIILNFGDDGKAKETLTKVKELLNLVTKEMNEVSAFLNDLATSSIPKSFDKYVFAVAQEIVNHCELTEKQYDVYYYLSTVNENLLFSAYIELRNVLNNDGDTIKSIWISVHWCVSEDIRVSLDYKWVPPVTLYLDSRIKVTNVNDTARAIDKMLDAEDFVVSIGTRPLDRFLNPNIPVDKISVSNLQMKGKIKSLDVEPDKITVTLANIPIAQLQQLHAQIYTGIKRLFTPKTKLRMAISKDGKTLVFTVTNYAQSKEFTTQDIDYFKSWGLTDSQIKKIEMILQ